MNVLSDGTVVDVLRARPIRVLPSGRAGVVFAGEVFPLRAGNAIDLDDERYNKADCAKFVSLGQRIPYVTSPVLQRTAGQFHVSRWNVEHVGAVPGTNYVVLDGDEDTAERVVELLEDVGLEVTRWNVSHRKAMVDGYQYDWYIQLAFDGPADEVLAHIRRANNSASAPATAPAVAEPRTPELADLRWNVEHVSGTGTNYVVLDADKDTAERVVHFLEDVGLEVARWNVSHRKAMVDGYQYDWYIQLASGGPGEEVLAHIQDAIDSRSIPGTSSVFAGPPTPELVARLADGRQSDAELQSQLAAQASEIARITAIVDGLDASVHQWQTAHEELKARASAMEDDLAQNHRRVAEEQRNRIAAEAALANLESVRDELRPSNSPEVTAEISWLRQEAEQSIARAEADRQAAEELGEDAEERASRYRARLLDTEAQLLAKDAELRRLTEEGRSLESHIAELSSADTEKEKLLEVERGRRRATRGKSARGFVSSVLPRLTLHEDALETLVALKDPLKVFDALFKLNARESLPAEMYKGSVGKNLRVMEVTGHFHIGDEGKGSDMGRIYFVKSHSGLLVYVHRKKNDAEQAQTVERFAAWCRRQMRDDGNA